MITKECAMSLSHGHVLHHKSAKNADGTPVRCRVNGRCKVWKTRPDEFRLPVKWGLKTCFYIELHNAKEWYDPQGCIFCGAQPVVGLPGSEVEGCEDLGKERVGLCQDCAFPEPTRDSLHPEGL